MTTTELLLTANSLLLSLLAIFLATIGYFLKDLHRKFTQLVNRVNTLYTDHSKEAATSQVHRDQQDKEISGLNARIHRLENQVFNPQG